MACVHARCSTQESGTFVRGEKRTDQVASSKPGYQPPFCFCASSLAAAGGGRSGHFLSAIAVVAKDADAREASIEALGDGARHSWRLPGDLLVASSRLMASPILTPSSNRSLWRARGGHGERRVLSQGIKAGRHGRHAACSIFATAAQQQLSPRHRRLQVGATSLQPPDRPGSQAGSKEREQQV